MKTGTTLKIITISLIVIALMSATAFAYIGHPSTESAVSAPTGQI